MVQRAGAFGGRRRQAAEGLAGGVEEVGLLGRHGQVERAAAGQPAVALDGAGEHVFHAGVAAVGVGHAAQAQPLRLLVWINGDKGYNGLQQVGDRFREASGVDVVVQHPEGAPDKFQAAAAAGKGPDIMCWPHDRVGEWAKSGLIVPV